LVPIKLSTLVNYKFNQLFDRQRCISNRGYSDYLDFIILFIGILLLYAINLGVVSLFADPPLRF